MEQWRYALSAPELGAQEQAAAVESLCSNACADHVQTFEKAFARLHRTNHAIAVANATAALHLALLAAEVGLSPEDEVIQPSINLPGAANMTLAVGARVMLADIVAVNEPTIDPNHVARLIGPDTKAVVVAHYGGNPARMAALNALCRAKNVALIEDVGPALGYVAPDLAHRALGTIGQIGCFSLGSGNALAGGAGGVVVTDDDELAARMRSLLRHDPETFQPVHDGTRRVTSDIMAHGFSYRMDPLCAVLGLAQLNAAPGAMGLRQRRAQAYANVVETFCDGAIEYVFGWAPGEGAAQVAAILVEPALRDGLRRFLAEKRIETGVHILPVHRLAAFSGSHRGGLPLSEDFAARVITLPLHAGLPVMAPEHIVRFCTTYLARRGGTAPVQSETCLQVA